MGISIKCLGPNRRTTSEVIADIKALLELEPTPEAQEQLERALKYWTEKLEKHTLRYYRVRKVDGKRVAFALKSGQQTLATRILGSVLFCQWRDGKNCATQAKRIWCNGT